MHSFSVRTPRRSAFVEITGQVQSYVQTAGVTEGVAVVFVPHTTAGITINENADPDVVHDLLLTLDRHFPQDAPGYRHAEGNSDSHIKASLMGSSCQVIVAGGRLVLGTWQGIYVCEFDGPRTRQVHVQLLPAAGK
jgi:secondary thiamine-phosphate synthase enzyme